MLTYAYRANKDKNERVNGEKIEGRREKKESTTHKMRNPFIFIPEIVFIAIVKWSRIKSTKLRN